MRLLLIICYVLCAFFLCSYVFVSCSTDNSSIAFWTHGWGESPAPNIRIWLKDTSATREFRVDPRSHFVGPVATSKSGDLTISFRLSTDGDESGTRRTISLPVKENWQWHVAYQVTPNDPLENCSGCLGSVGYDLDPALGYESAMKLYVMWSGHEIRVPVE